MRRPAHTVLSPLDSVATYAARADGRRQIITQLSAERLEATELEDNTRHRLVALAGGLLIFAASIALVTARPDRGQPLSAANSQQAVATTIVATSTPPTPNPTSNGTSAAPLSPTASPVAPVPAQIPRPTPAPTSEVVATVVNGRLQYAIDGSPAAGVTVDLLASDQSNKIVATLVTDAEGRYGFQVDDGCYSTMFTAPPGYVFPAVGEVMTGPSICSTSDAPFTFSASIEPAG